MKWTSLLEYSLARDVSLSPSLQKMWSDSLGSRQIQLERIGHLYNDDELIR